MIYRKNIKNGDEISQLAFGCMRFKSEESAEKQVAAAIENGINYFDTAYIYPGNEAMLGRILAKLGARKKVKIATKLPPYFVKKHEDFNKLFSIQLERLKTDYIDYYLIHMLSCEADWARLVSLGALEWIKENKENGRIKNLGFSFHGGAADYINIIDSFDWDFTMIQYNYLDENNQAGKSGLLYAAEKGIPVMIMEPLRGGSLVRQLPPNVASLFNEAVPKRSPAEWALRWVFNHPQVLTVLSGMNSDYAVTENIKTASEARPDMFTEYENGIFEKVRKMLNDAAGIGCTGCGYCMPCPFGVDIPLCFSLYNDIKITGKIKTRFNYIVRANKSAASRCERCGKCETHCPQGLKIKSELSKVKKAIESGYYKPLRFTVKKILKLEK